MHEVKSLKIGGSDEKDVLNMIYMVERAYRDLDLLGQASELYNSTSISIIEQAMTREMKNEWVKEIASHPSTSSQNYSSKARFVGLIDFLKNWRNRLEYMGASIREDPCARRRRSP